MDAETTLTRVRDALAERADVHVAIVFGSVARGTPTPASDVDIAVLAPGVDLLALNDDLARAVGADVDLVQLQRASIPLLAAIVREGVPVHEGPRGAEPRWRSSTLAMLETDEPAYLRMADAWLAKLAGERRVVDVGIIAAKLLEVEDRISTVRASAKADAGELRADRDAQDLVAFNLMLAVQAAADLATHVIATERWPVATSLRDAFDRLRDRGVLSEETTRAMGAAVGLRNVVAHGYAGVDVDMLHAASRSGVLDLERFCKEVSAWARGRTSAAPRTSG